MMNYEIFKEVVKDSFKDYLPEQYKDMVLFGKLNDAPFVTLNDAVPV